MKLITHDPLGRAIKPNTSPSVAVNRLFAGDDEHIDVLYDWIHRGRIKRQRGTAHCGCERAASSPYLPCSELKIAPVWFEANGTARTFAAYSSP